jgi:hypothetical protein
MCAAGEANKAKDRDADHATHFLSLLREDRESNASDAGLVKMAI